MFIAPVYFDWHGHAAELTVGGAIAVQWCSCSEWHSAIIAHEKKIDQLSQCLFRSIGSTYMLIRLVSDIDKQLLSYSLASLSNTTEERTYVISSFLRAVHFSFLKVRIGCICTLTDKSLYLLVSYLIASHVVKEGQERRCHDAATMMLIITVCIIVASRWRLRANNTSKL